MSPEPCAPLDDFTERFHGARIALLTIQSGGQTGVDRAALQVAVALGTHYGGWCPKGGWAEDSPTPPGVRAHYPLLVETPSADPRQRTAWNVRDSDATILMMKGNSPDSPGTEFTRVCAELVFQRPIFVVRLDDRQSVTDAQRWLAELLRDTSRTTFTLNVAGPRESEIPGIATLAAVVLREILAVAVPVERGS
jgi:hypothetical protein